MKVLSIVGARPQFVKAAVVCRALAAAGVDERVVHTGQHYDENMSRVFFDELAIPRPHVDLGVGSGTHAFQTGETLQRLEPVCLELKPDAVLIYGDTNATLAGALVAAKLRVPLAHVEAGLRSFDRTMPEEVNRVVADRLSRWLFCPTDTAVRNLAAEGMAEGAHNVGDVMYDAALFYRGLARERSRALERLALEPGGYVLATIHRDFNTDRPDRLRAIVEGLAACGRPVVFPVHPRTRKQIEAHGLGAAASAANLRLVEPVGYLDMVRLEAAAACIVTDSGGVQKEALFHGVPCVTVRPSTEWPETVAAGWNRLVEARAQDVAEAVRAAKPPPGPLCRAFGDGQAAGKIARLLGAYGGGRGTGVQTPTGLPGG